MILSVRVSVCIFTLLSLMACVSHSQARLPAPEVLPSASPAARPEASAPAASDKLPQGAARPTAQPAASPSASPAGTGGSDTASTLLPISPLHDPLVRGGGGSGGGRSGGSTGTPQPSPTPLFYIADVTLADTGQSVMGANAPAALAPVYTADAPIDLLITGNFATTIPFSEAAMRFTFEPGLLHQSFSGDAPAVRVLLNESLLLEPLSINTEALRVRLHQYLLPDIYLQGLHTLSVYAGAQSISTQIQVGAPAAPATLIPVLEQVTFFAAQDNAPAALRLAGKHFLLQTAWQQVVFQEQTMTVSQVEINADGQAMAWVTLDFEPEPGSHTVRYQTPFGVVNQEIVIP